MSTNDEKNLAAVMASMSKQKASLQEFLGMAMTATWRGLDKPHGRTTDIGGDSWEKTTQQAIDFIDSDGVILILGTPVGVVRSGGGHLRSDANGRLSDNVETLSVRKVAGVVGNYNRRGVRHY